MVDSTAGTLKQISRVFKLRIAAAITLCAIAGMAITPGVSFALAKIAVLAVAVFLSSAGASAFNQHFIFLGAFVYGAVYTIWLKRRSA